MITNLRVMPKSRKKHETKKQRDKIYYGSRRDKKRNQKRL